MSDVVKRTAIMAEPLLSKEDGKSNFDATKGSVSASKGVAVIDSDVSTGDRGTNNYEGLEEGLVVAEDKLESKYNDSTPSNTPASIGIGFPSRRATLLFLINAFLCQFASFFGQQLTMRLMSDVLGVDPTTVSSRIVLVLLWTVVVFSEFILLRSVLIDVLLSSGHSSGGSGSSSEGSKIGGGSGRIRAEHAGEAGIDRAFVLGSLGGCGLILIVLQIWTDGPVTAEMCFAWAITLVGLVGFGCFPSKFLRDQE